MCNIQIFYFFTLSLRSVQNQLDAVGNESIASSEHHSGPCLTKCRTTFDQVIAASRGFVFWKQYILLFSKKMVLFHIAAKRWIRPQTGYKIQGSYTKLNHIVKTKIGNLKATVTSKTTLYNQIKT